MPLVAGARLGVYEIVSPLGSGGMGEVYRARDTRLNRDVAIKVLQSSVASDLDRLARFSREAQILASLNHPNIAHVYGVEDSALVMELVEGPTLADRIAQGPIEMNDALPIAQQIALALEAAHERGIIHRDLKPANIKVRADGTVKVLDFGLAKATDPAGSASPNAMDSPTIAAATVKGVILGTTVYMSPEQARGKSVDKRADVWAFGCVLYEMLTGRRTFDGDHSTDVIAAVMRQDPDWAKLPRGTPSAVRRLLGRCLDKDPAWRLHDIGDARIELREAAAAPAADPGALPRPSRTLLVAAAVVAAAVCASVVTWAVTRRPSAPAAVQRFSLDVSAGVLALNESRVISNSHSIALSPDGATLVYVGPGIGKDTSRLYARSSAAFEPRAIEGTDGASAPFFSADGQSVAFFAGGKLKRVGLAGGGAATVCDAPEDTGGSAGAWGRSGTIVFAVRRSDRAGLFRVPATGGVPEALTSPDPKEEGGHGDPSFVGDAAVLFTSTSNRAGVRASVQVLSLRTGEHHKLADGDAHPLYTATGHLVFGRASAILAVPFDPQSLQATGTPITMVENVQSGFHFDVSASGRLAYLPATPYGGQPVWVDRNGTAAPIVEDGRAFARPRLSPDGTRLVAEVVRDSRIDIAVYRLDNRTLTLITTDGVSNSPFWNPDGRTVVFRGRGALFSAPADATTPPEIFLSATDPALKEISAVAPGAFSADGLLYLFVVHGSTETGADIWTLRTGPTRRMEPLVRRRGDQWGVRISPDGRWISYASNESGVFEIYVEPVAGPRNKQLVSVDGGMEAVWSRDGTELFYRNGDRMMAAAVTHRDESPIGAPHLLFRGRYVSTDIPHYDVTGDGKRFVMIRPQDAAESRSVRVVDQWFEELKLRVPAQN